MVSGPRADFLDCPPLDEGLELGSLSAHALHGGKGSKDALNGFPFNSAAGGHSMLNSYGVGGPDLGSKLRSDVLVGQQGSSEETGLMAPSVELDRLQVTALMTSDVLLCCFKMVLLCSTLHHYYRSSIRITSYYNPTHFQPLS